MRKVRLTQIDGPLPNLALMKLAHWHRSLGDEVVLTRWIDRDMFEPAYDLVYGSAIFRFSQDKLMRFRQQWPEAIVGGSGTCESRTIEDLIGGEYEHYDYADYPGTDFSIGFTQRGCRLRCKFCEVPKKEGKARSANTIAGIWRGPPWPRKLHLLDNDFFGNPDWRERVAEIRDGRFRVCLSQGINVRLIDDEAAAALSTIEYRDGEFQQRRLYTAWDNLRDEAVFFRGVDRLERAGVPSKHLMAYMLVGYDPDETWDRIWHRFNRMTERGIRPFPMVFDRRRTDLIAFQRWACRGLYRAVPWNEYVRETKSIESVEAFERSVAPGLLLNQNLA